MSSQSNRNLTIQRIQSSESSQTRGFFVQSTATINVEDKPIPLNQTFDEIQDEAVKVLLDSKDPQINIYVHGYSVKHSQARDRTHQLYQAAQSHHHPGQLVFGFLWPSENPTHDNSQITAQPPINPPKAAIQKIKYAFESLPTVLLIAFFSSFLLGLTAWGLLLAPAVPLTPLNAGLLAVLVGVISNVLLAIAKAFPLFPLTIVHALAAVGILWLTQFPVGRTIALILSDATALLFGMLFGLILLRLVTYLRDRERASYFAVYDLVELIRKLDKAVWEAGEKQGIPAENWKLASELKAGETGQQRVELNIMAHSLGCMVVTNAIRILSDVFDPAAVEKTPNSKLGKTLSLERLVLIAPDIPIEAVLPGRSNFLTSTLKRCREPYVFMNEGDLALRLASTAANYVSYFSRDRFGGYRLGNLTCQRGSKHLQYGILNPEKTQLPHTCLDVRSSEKEKKSLIKLYEDRQNGSLEPWTDAIADVITYFDCTDYEDTKHPSDRTPMPILTSAKGQVALNFLDYCGLAVKYFVLGQVDTHGGYFAGRLSQELLHELILSGFQQYLERHHDGSLKTFSATMSEKKIQVVVSRQFSKRFCLTRPKRTS